MITSYNREPQANSYRERSELKTSIMKKHNFLYLILLIANTSLLAQSLDFSIENKTTTATEVTFDVTLASDTPFKLGSGQLYFNFNTAAFGEWVIDNDAVTISYPDGSVLAQSNGFPLYTSFVQNDNIASRFSFSWQQGVSSGTYPSDNITSTPAVLFQVSIAFIAGGEGQSDDICFESSAVFDDQTFTACGPESFGFADCLTYPGTQLVDDNFECNLMFFPIDLLEFRAQARADFTTLLHWTTANEYNNAYFTIERSINGKDFEAIAKIPGAGFSNAELNYQTIDPTPQIGVNYYRLQQTDFDGSSSYSDIQAVSFKNEDLIEVSIYPNPSTNYATLFTPVNFDNGLLEIYDLQGKRMLTKQLASGRTRMEVQLAAWPAGIYLLKVSLDGQHTTRQLVVQE